MCSSDLRQREGHQALVVQVIGQIVVCAVEKPAQQVVPRVTLLLNHTDDTAHGNTDQGQCVRRQHERPFNGLRNHLGRASLLQCLELVVVLCSYNNGDLRGMAPDMAQTLFGSRHD